MLSSVALPLAKLLAQLGTAANAFTLLSVYWLIKNLVCGVAFAVGYVVTPSASNVKPNILASLGVGDPTPTLAISGVAFAPKGNILEQTQTIKQHDADLFIGTSGRIEGHGKLDYAGIELGRSLASEV